MLNAECWRSIELSNKFTIFMNFFFFLQHLCTHFKWITIANNSYEKNLLGIFLFLFLFWDRRDWVGNWVMMMAKGLYFKWPPPPEGKRWKMMLSWWLSMSVKAKDYSSRNNSNKYNQSPSQTRQLPLNWAIWRVLGYPLLMMFHILLYLYLYIYIYVSMMHDLV